MTDGNLLAFGCAVSFIAVAGAYVYIRERFLEQYQAPRGRKPREQARDRRIRRVA